MSEDIGIKIAPHLRNPIDNFFYDIIKVITPTFKKIHFTPNFITLLSLLFSLIGIFLFFKQQYLVLAAILFMVGYFCDCWDGYFARKYNMVSKTGDLFDHISDAIKYVLFIYVLFVIRKNNPHFYKYFTVIVILTILVVVQTGCEERIYNKNEESITLKITQPFCPNTNIIHYTRFFGPGTLMVVLSIIMIIYRRFV